MAIFNSYVKLPEGIITSPGLVEAIKAYVNGAKYRKAYVILCGRPCL